MELLSLSFNSIAIVLGLSALCYLAWHEPRHGLYVIIALLPSYLIRFSVAGIPTTFLELSIILVFILWLAKDSKWRHLNLWFAKAQKGQKVFNAIPPVFRVALSLVLISAFVASLISPNTARAASQLKVYFLEPVMMFIMLAYELKNTKHIEHVFQLLGLTTIVIGVLAIWQSLTGLGIPNPFWAAEATRRITTFFGYPNANSLFVAPIVACFIGYIFIKSSLHNTVYKIIVITLGIITLITASSTGALAAIAVVGCVMMLRFSRTRAIGIAILIIIITLFLHSPTVHEHFAKLAQTVAENHLDLTSTSLEIRFNQWRETLLLLGDHPFFGSGLAGYQQALAPYHSYSFLEIYLYPHNIFLNFWAELGLLGLFSFALLMVGIGQTLAASLKKKKQNAWAWCIILAWIGILIHGLVDVPYFKNDLAIVWMIFAVLPIIIQKIKAAPVRAAKTNRVATR